MHGADETSGSLFSHDGKPLGPDRAGRPDRGRRTRGTAGRTGHDPSPFPGSTRRLKHGAEFVAELRQACVSPHVAQKSRYSEIVGRTNRGALSIKHRKRNVLRRDNGPPVPRPILLTFGWAKTIARMAQTVYRGIERARSRFSLTMAAKNLTRAPHPEPRRPLVLRPDAASPRHDGRSSPGRPPSPGSATGHSCPISTSWQCRPWPQGPDQ